MINLTLYEPSIPKQIFGMLGTMPIALTMEYISANEDFVNFMNDINKDIKFNFDDIRKYLNFNVQYNCTNDFMIKTQVNSNYNKLNICRLNHMLLNDYIYVKNNFYTPYSNYVVLK